VILASFFRGISTTTPEGMFTPFQANSPIRPSSSMGGLGRR
jgi:hypothetical protein